MDCHNNGFACELLKINLEIVNKMIVDCFPVNPVYLDYCFCWIIELAILFEIH